MNENVLILLNHFKYFYSIESSFKQKNYSKGTNGTDIADLRIDIENIIYNETIHMIIYILLKQYGINYLEQLQIKSELITKGFQIIFNTLDKAVIFKIIKDELLKNNQFKKDKKACKYLDNDIKVFVSWLDFRTIFFIVVNYVQNILIKKINFIIVKFFIFITLYHNKRLI